MIATKESDFAEAWKDLLVRATEEDTWSRGGSSAPCASSATPAPWNWSTRRSGCSGPLQGQSDGSTPEIIDLEVTGLENLFKGNIEKTPVLGGQVAGRIQTFPR